MTSLWSFLPAHGTVCLAYAPPWYVPLLATLLAITVASYFAIGIVLVSHALRRRLAIARELAWMYGVFVFVCGITHAVAAVTLYVGGKAYLWLLITTLVMASTSLAAAAATVVLKRKADAIGSRIDHISLADKLRDN